MGTLRRADGSRTEDQKKTLESRLGTHFPGGQLIDDQDPDVIYIVSVSAYHKRLYREIRELISLRRTR